MSAINAFISYSHADEKLLDRFHKHLAMLQREGSLTAWTDHVILPGGNVADEINTSLKSTNVFIALVSPDYLASNYCYDKEFIYALALAESGKLRIVPIILEPCDWLSSPFKDFLALPKDGQAISVWTNQNNAFLDVVTGLRRLLQASASVSVSASDKTPFAVPTAGKHVRVKQDFDSIQKSDFADKAYEIIKNYFNASCNELNDVGDTIKAKFEVMDGTAFTCSVVNRAKIRGGEAHITVRNSKTRGHFGDISYVYQRYAEVNSSNGAFNVNADDYNLFLTANAMSAMMSGNQAAKLSSEQAAEDLWNGFVAKAGIEYE